jgi:hypothetical protein
MSEIKVNKISPRTNCGTVTLGDSGDTFTIPSGATITNAGTATGFGATGAVSWNTTVKTSTFTAVAGEGYFVNTTGGQVTVNLPAGTAGAVVGIKDYAGTFDTNKVTVAPNGSDKIGGDSTADGTLTTEGIAVTFVFIDSTQGWLVTDSGLQSELPTAQYIVATGGTITCSGNFKIHTFTGPGTFTVCSVGNSAGSNTIDYLVVAGGGGGGGDGPGGNTSDGGGGGGAGGYRESSGAASGCYTVSPLGSGVSALPVTATGYPVTVGAGGTGTTPSSIGTAGSNSVFTGSTTITSAGGGLGGSRNETIPGKPVNAGGNGGSGGGAGGDGTDALGGSGNTPPVSPAQGSNGGAAGSSGYSGSPSYGSGGGGGATAVGTDATPTQAGPGGAGGTSSINGTPTARAGGGGGGSQGPAPQVGSGTGGGGSGGNNCSSTDATAGTANTGGGGGGGDGPGPNGDGKGGGSGIVIIRYKYQ